MAHALPPPASHQLISHLAVFRPLPSAVSPELYPIWQWQVRYVGIAAALKAIAVCTLCQLCFPIAGVTTGLKSSGWREAFGSGPDIEDDWPIGSG